MSDMPKEIWAESDGDDIIIHNNSPDLEGLIATGYLSHYTRTDTVTALQAEVDRLREAARAVIAAADKWNAEQSREAFEAMSWAIDATRAALSGDDT